MRRVRAAPAHVPLAVGWGGRGETAAAAVLWAAMSGFGAAALLSGSSAAAGTRSGSSDSLEKIDMSLGERGAAGKREGLRLIRALGEGWAGRSGAGPRPAGVSRPRPASQQRLKLVSC